MRTSNKETGILNYGLWGTRVPAAFPVRRKETAAVQCQPSGGRAVWVRPEPERDPGGAKYWSRSDSLKKLLPRTRGAGQRRREQGP